MPARVHAILVTRSSGDSLARVQRALGALSAQVLRPNALTIVVRGSSSALRGDASVASAAEAVIETRANSSLAAAVALAAPRMQEGSSVWILTQDLVPEPGALSSLVGALERSPSAAIAAPKLVDVEEADRIVSFGQSMTRYGRAIDAASGELDQGQHDAQDDALGADVRGLLIRSGQWRGLQPDPGLGGSDEGLDLGVRARLAGSRVALTAAARIGTISPTKRRASARRAFASRRAQLHRRLSYAPALGVAFHWLSLLPLALWRSITHLIGKRPAAVLPEWGAAAVAMASGGAVAQSRRAIKAGRNASWASIAPLRVSRGELRQRLDDGHGAEAGTAQELDFFAGGGAWAVLAGLVVSIASFTALLAWPALGGGALLPMRQTVGALWRDAAYGLRGLGVDVVGPADPFAGVLAVLGSLWPAAPSFALVLLWVAALPLAVLGGWFAATRITDRPGLRIFAGAIWALAPTFVIALAQGRPAAVLAHLLLPWLFFAALVAGRSWGAVGAASLLAVAVLACAPSLAPALVLLWLVALGTLLSRGSLRGTVRMLWTLIPAAVVFAPLVAWQVVQGNPWALLADPGSVALLPQAGADESGRLALAAGIPTADDAGWAAMIGAPAPWALLLCAPLVVLALLGPLAPRWAAGILSVLVAGVGLTTAFAVVGIVVSFDHSATTAIWPGTALSLAWIGTLGAALVALDSTVTLPGLRRASSLVAALAIAACALPSLTAVARDASVLTNGPLSTLPAYVNAQAREDREVGTLVLSAQGDGGLGAQVVWGASETLGAQATILSTATQPRGDGVAEFSADLISARVFDAPAQLSALGVRYVLLDAEEEEETGPARERRLGAVTALDQRAGFVRVGETAKGVLWRLEAEPAPRAEPTLAQSSTARLVTTIELVVLLAALLLAIPTRASRRAARGLPRAVGLVPARAPRPDPEESEPSAADEGRKGGRARRAFRRAVAPSLEASGSAEVPPPSNPSADEERPSDEGVATATSSLAPGADDPGADDPGVEEPVVETSLSEQDDPGQDRSSPGDAAPRSSEGADAPVVPAEKSVEKEER